MNDKNILRIIYLFSAIVLIIILVLFNMPTAEHIPAYVRYLPMLNACINATCSFLLLISLWQIKKGNIALHKKINISTFILSALFLLSYVLFHYHGIETKFGDINHDGITDEAEKLQVGAGRYVYYFILLTHILLAAIVLPLILISFYFGLSDQRTRHRKIVRWSYPIWLYVTVSGVLVYLMVAPYYSF